MPRKSKKRLSEMTRKEIITRLNRRGALPPQTIAAIATRIIDRRKAAKKAASEAARHKDKWNLIIQPLSKEIRSVQTRLAQFKKRENIPLSTFYSSYLSALVRVRDILKAYQRQPLTPDQKVKEVKLSAEGILPLSLTRLSLGHHWSDWVPVRIRTEFRRAHASINAKTKPIAPIFQRDPSKTVLAQRHAVLTKWKEEMAQLQDVVTRDGIQRRPHEAIQSQLIARAINKAEAQGKVDKRLTPYWSKLLTTAEHNEVRQRVREAIESEGGRVATRKATDGQPVHESEVPMQFNVVGRYGTEPEAGMQVLEANRRFMEFMRRQEEQAVQAQENSDDDN